METKIGFFEQFYLALVKHKLYIVLTRLPKKRHVVYFLGITFLLGMIAYVVPMASFLASLGGYEHFFAEKLPAFTIENGTLSIEKTLDFRLNQIHIVVDDSVEKYTEADLENLEEYVVMFSRKNVVTNLSAIPTALDYSMFGSELIDNQKMVSKAGQFYGAVVTMGMIAWLSQMCSYALLALLFAVCGIGINKMSGANLPFGKIYCIALYAETMFALVSHLVNYFFTGAVAFIIYLVSAVISLRAVNTGVLMYTILPKDK